MLKRQCEKCKGFIPLGTPFYKICESKMVGQTQRLRHVGDLCEDCWLKILKGE
jgi:hypothetical protein